MSTDPILLTANSVNALAQQQASRRDEWSRGFWIGLAGAAIVHVALLVGFARHAPRYLGDASGSPDAINVELVDAAELKSLETGTGESPPPGAPTPPPQPQAAPEPPPPQPEAKQPEAKEPAEKPVPEAKAEQPAEAAPADQPASVLPVEKEKPQPAPPQQESVKEHAQEKQEKQEKKAEAKPQPKKELKPPNELDLSLPKEMSMASPYEDFGSATSAVGRPAGITRSGANDDFGRGVVRALKKTMPPATGTKGKVTIRLILDERGNIATLKLVQPAGIRDLDDGVMFSAQQASFPFPPQGATVADRTFLITYVYK